VTALEEYQRFKADERFTESTVTIKADAAIEYLVRELRALETAARRLDTNAGLLWEQEYPLGEFPTLAELREQASLKPSPDVLH